MNNMEKLRCITLFEESCRSDKTRKTYSNLLNTFLEWSNKDHVSLLALSDSELQILLEDYMLYCKKRFKKAGIITRFSAIKKFLFVNDRNVNQKKLMMFLPETKKAHQRAITTDEIRDLIAHTSSKRVRAIIHIFSATGLRPEALLNIKMKDVGQMPDNCMSLILYSETNNELTTFIHPEASMALSEYLDERKDMGELLTPDSYLIRRKTFVVNENKPKPLTISGLESTMFNAITHSNIKRVKVNEDRFDLPVCGGFRNRFNTILKMNPDISFVIAEMFMDHKVGLESHYTIPTKEQLFEEYKKAMPELMIDETAKQKVEIQKLESEKSELEQLQIENKGLLKSQMKAYFKELMDEETIAKLKGEKVPIDEYDPSLDNKR